MSYTYLLGTGEVSSAESYREILPYAPLKSMNDVGRYYFNGNEIKYFLGFQFGMTSERSMERLGEISHKSLAVDFHAQTYLPLGPIAKSMESKRDWTEKALDCGKRWRELLSRFNLALCVLKTPRIFELKDLPDYSKTLTAWGIMRDGVCFNVATTARIISEEGFSSLLPTPTAHNAKEGAFPAEFTRNTPTLAAQVGGRINPDWNEWRMGCPIKWSDLNPLETDKFRQWLHLHGVYYQKE